MLTVIQLKISLIVLSFLFAILTLLYAQERRELAAEHRVLETERHREEFVRQLHKDQREDSSAIGNTEKSFHAYRTK